MRNVQTQTTATAIVQALKEYGEIPVGFLARVLGRRQSEIQDSLQALEEKHLVHRSEDRVKLESDTTS